MIRRYPRWPIFAALCLVTLVLVAWLVVNERSRIIDKQQDLVATVSTIITGRYSEFETQVIAIRNSIQPDFSHYQLGGRNALAVLEKALVRLAAQDAFLIEALVFDRDGYVIASSSNPTSWTLASDHPLLAFSNDVTFLAPTVLDQGLGHGRTVHLLSIGLRGLSGDDDAAIGFVYDPAKQQNFITSAGPDAFTAVSVLTEDTVILAARPSVHDDLPLSRTAGFFAETQAQGTPVRVAASASLDAVLAAEWTPTALAAGAAVCVFLVVLLFSIARLFRSELQREQSEETALRATEALADSALSAVSAISKTLEKRDPYTSGHSERVAELSVAIAKQLGWDDFRIEGLMLGALLHDVGKIYIPAEILVRPGRLTDHEMGIIRSHPGVSGDILSESKFPWPLREFAEQHHERMDGSGYPHGLRGEAIHLEARIIAVADVVEAISAHRPYRAALGVDKGLAEIKKGRGSLFDPTVVDACLTVFETKNFAWST